MSEQVPERTSGGGGNVFTRKLGPLPMWGWMGIALLVAVLFYIVKKKSSSSSSTSDASTNAAAAGQAAGGVDSSLVPQFVNQTYENVSPPSAPNLTINNNLPAPATGGTQPSPTPAPTQTGTPKPPAVSKYTAPTGLSTKKVSATSLTATWSNLTGVTPAPTSYTVAAYSKAGKLLTQQTVNAPDTTGGKSTVTLTGLPANSQGVQVHVWANGGQLAPPHATSTVTL